MKVGVVAQGAGRGLPFAKKAEEKKKEKPSEEVVVVHSCSARVATRSALDKSISIPNFPLFSCALPPNLMRFVMVKQYGFLSSKSWKVRRSSMRWLRKANTEHLTSISGIRPFATASFLRLSSTSTTPLKNQKKTSAPAPRPRPPPRRHRRPLPRPALRRLRRGLDRLQPEVGFPEKHDAIALFDGGGIHKLLRVSRAGVFGFFVLSARVRRQQGLSWARDRPRSSACVLCRS